jgi:hypothetical protein
LFHPDLIILQWSGDDRLNRTEWEEFVNSYIERYLTEHNLGKEKLDRFTYDQIHSEAHKAYMTFKLLNESPAKLKVELEEEFKELEEIAYKQRAKIVLLFFHTITTEKPILQQIAAKYEYPIVDCDKYEKYVLHEKDKHPNQLGHRFIALEIYKKLIELSLI